MAIFEIAGGKFLYDGKPVRLLSGAIHYFRVVPEYWRDRLLKLKACGLNTVETYVAWNLHEPEPGEYNFSGMADLVSFIETAGELGLYVIVRPGPYICAEWEFGGLPWWLLQDPTMRVRCFHRPFLEKVDRYFDVLIPKLVPLQCTQGGPIIAMQVENEYGSFGNDLRYLEHLKDALRKRGVDVLLFTSDGPSDLLLQGGTMPFIFKTVNFGSSPKEAFAKLKEYQPDKPLVCMEYWNGWYDQWGEEHRTRPPEEAAAVLDEMLQLGASVNFYMFHGGTNFGFYNGAGCREKYLPTVTSYDYDAPVSESGDLTEKYFQVRDVIAKYAPVDPDLLPQPIPKKAYGKVELTQQASLWDAVDQISKPVFSTYPETMDNLGQDYGFVLYRTELSGPIPEAELYIQEPRDRALVYLDGEFRGAAMRDEPQNITIAVISEVAQLDILVENMGRINYGPHLLDRKGITCGVRLNNQFQFSWACYPLPLKDLSALKFQEKPGKLPAFFCGTFEVDEAADTFLALEGWTKGVVFLNGFNLGRYWKIGPTKTLYVPGPLLRQGENELIVFELEGAEEPVVEFVDKANLG